MGSLLEQRRVQPQQAGQGVLAERADAVQHLVDGVVGGRDQIVAAGLGARGRGSAQARPPHRRPRLQRRLEQRQQVVEADRLWLCDLAERVSAASSAASAAISPSATRREATAWASRLCSAPRRTAGSSSLRKGAVWSSSSAERSASRSARSASVSVEAACGSAERLSRRLRGEQAAQLVGVGGYGGLVIVGGHGVILLVGGKWRDVVQRT